METQTCIILHNAFFGGGVTKTSEDNAPYSTNFSTCQRLEPNDKSPVKSPVLIRNSSYLDIR